VLTSKDASYNIVLGIVISVLRISSRLEIDMTQCIFNDGLNCVSTLNSGNFQYESQHLHLIYDMIDEAMAMGKIEIKHVDGMEMLADALTTALGGVKLGEYAKEIGLS
jgi:hypothetical protein